MESDFMAELDEQIFSLWIGDEVEEDHHEVEKKKIRRKKLKGEKGKSSKLLQGLTGLLDVKEEQILNWGQWEEDVEFMGIKIPPLVALLFIPCYLFNNPLEIDLKRQFNKENKKLRTYAKIHFYIKDELKFNLVKKYLKLKRKRQDGTFFISSLEYCKTYHLVNYKGEGFLSENYSDWDYKEKIGFFYLMKNNNFVSHLVNLMEGRYGKNVFEKNNIDIDEIVDLANRGIVPGSKIVNVCKKDLTKANFREFLNKNSLELLNEEKWYDLYVKMRNWSIESFYTDIGHPRYSCALVEGPEIGLENDGLIAFDFSDFVGRSSPGSWEEEDYIEAYHRCLGIPLDISEENEPYTILYQHNYVSKYRRCVSKKSYDSIVTQANAINKDVDVESRKDHKDFHVEFHHFPTQEFCLRYNLKVSNPEYMDPLTKEGHQGKVVNPHMTNKEIIKAYLEKTRMPKKRIQVICKGKLSAIEMEEEIYGLGKQASIEFKKDMIENGLFEKEKDRISSSQKKI